MLLVAVIMICALGFIVFEYNQLLNKGALNYFSSIYNIFDILGFILIITYCIIRFFSLTSVKTYGIILIVATSFLFLRFIT